MKSKFKVVIRWLLFFPAGIIGCMLFRTVVNTSMYGNPEWQVGAFATASEPWGFLFLSLWIIPRWHRSLILIFSIIYIAAYSADLIYCLLWFSKKQSIHEITLQIITSLSGIVSSAISMAYFLRKYKKEVITISKTDNHA